MRKVAQNWLWAVIIAGALMVVLTPQPTPPTTNNAGQAGETWMVPKLALRGATPAQVSELTRSNLWGGSLQTDASNSEQSNKWRLAGIAGRTGDRYVLVQFNDNRLMPLKAGDQFPDGTPIVAVHENSICVTIEGRKRLLPLPGQTPPITW